MGAGRGLLHPVGCAGRRGAEWRGVWWDPAEVPGSAKDGRCPSPQEPGRLTCYRWGRRKGLWELTQPAQGRAACKCLETTQVGSARKMTSRLLVLSQGQCCDLHNCWAISNRLGGSELRFGTSQGPILQRRTRWESCPEPSWLSGPQRWPWVLGTGWVPTLWVQFTASNPVRDMKG